MAMNMKFILPMLGCMWIAIALMSFANLFESAASALNWLALPFIFAAFMLQIFERNHRVILS